ncbi:DUF6930 domain-containing protein [Leptodesmis sp.]|uniref:DUF6930 domain-containing protein n=1 Tax=Leptodesmis sp. TaxID=3100501 RepID=UPI004053549F
MTALNHSTRRRLQKLKQIPNVWEGDRRRLITSQDSDVLDLASGEPPEGDCILWVDGSQGMVRAMDVVTPDSGPEAVVRTLIRAMENPHNPGMPARPKKIVVRDRELQFFLRGVLQDLDITLDYVPELPLIDEIFRGLQDAISTRPPQLPPQYAEALRAKAFEIWQDAPWEVLADHEIIAIELNQWDVGTLYASVMGMLGMEYGVLLYRSLDSLKQFRQRAIAQESIEQMQEAFLGQDCLFVTFETEESNKESPLMGFRPMPAAEDVEPVFGNLHPLEGLRSFLYDEEAAALLVGLEALHRFMRQHRQKFAKDAFPPLSSRYRIPFPDDAEAGTITLSVKVATMPELAEELVAMEGEEINLNGFNFPAVRDDLVPENSFLSLGMVPWDVLELLQSGAEYHQSTADLVKQGDGLPVVMIQTSRPKAKTMIQEIQAAGGLKAICFNPGEDPLMGDRYDIGLFQTGNGDLHLFGEFGEDDPTHIAARKKWDQRCKKTKGHCGLIIAKGLTGAARGNPQFKDMLALFETRSLSSKDLGLGTLQMTMTVDWT